MAAQFTLTGKFVAGDNTPSRALIQVSWRHPYRATGVILGTDVREKELDSSGAFSIVVPLPSGLQADPVLRVDYLPKVGQADVRYFAISRSTSGTVDLSSLTAVDSPDGWLARLADLIPGPPGADGADGAPGPTGRGIANISGDGNGNLIFTMTSGQPIVVPVLSLGSAGPATFGSAPFGNAPFGGEQ